MLQIIANIRSQYRIALLLIAGLSSCSALLIQSMLSVQQKDATVINIAGMQRMLSQRIAWHSAYLSWHHAPNQQQAQANTEAVHLALTQDLASFDDNHQQLIKRDASGDYLYLTPELHALYFEEPVKLNQQVEDFIALATDLSTHNTLSKKHLDALQIQPMTALLNHLDHAVKQFENNAVDKIELLSHLELFLWLLTLLVLVFELKFIFMPLEKKVQDAFTRYQQQKEKAELATTVRERFIARTNHELRTPLQGLLFSLDELATNSDDSGNLKKAQNYAHRLRLLLDEFNDFEQFESGLWQLNITSHSLQSTLDTTIKPFEQICLQQGLIWQYECLGDMSIKLDTDHERLAKVIKELIDNAIKFTEHGHVKINCHLHHSQGEESTLKITIEDSGRGFKTDLFEHDNAQDKQSNHFQGLHLGLIRVKHILNAMDATMQLTGCHPHGTKISLQVPLAHCTESNIELPTKLHCLIVEDNPLNAVILGKTLDQLEYTHYEVANGLKAVEHQNLAAFDVIFMDLNMPVMDGFQAIEILRKDKNITVPIIVITANTSERDIKLAYQCGADGHVHKPFNLADLKAVLGQYFNK
ncbi:hypothetical protein PULV_a0249 [Pseudoalteromonas ulvae UL12]|uniref:response regulator n=1 Tax=Pseudoalteromonas ulvae TaxID=107327 RepID=UPI00186B8C45|nr:response regulator [Pseudoalteromonas ulvae]MBE0362706.1 hypothetical protein [Pseudoalteromonas ulvae UL12]